MNREMLSCSLILVFVLDLLLSPCTQAAPAASRRALRAAAAQKVQIEYNPDVSLTDLVQGEETLTRKRRHAVSEAGDNLDLEEHELIRELQREVTRNRRSTVMLALVGMMGRCKYNTRCNVEYQEGNKKVRLRIADE